MIVIKKFDWEDGDVDQKINDGHDHRSLGLLLLQPQLALLPHQVDLLRTFSWFMIMLTWYHHWVISHNPCDYHHGGYHYELGSAVIYYDVGNYAQKNTAQSSPPPASCRQCWGWRAPLWPPSASRTGPPPPWSRSSAPAIHMFMIWQKHFYLFVFREENSPCSPPQSSEQGGKECRSSHLEKEFCQNCKTDLCHTLLTDTFVLWTYLSDMIKFEHASTWQKCSQTISAQSKARSTPRSNHQQPSQKNRPRRPNPA